MKALLSSPNINVNIQDSTGRTALSVAARHGHTECVNLLLACKKTDLRLVYKDGFTKLHLAAASGMMGMMKEIIEDNTVDINGKTNIDKFEGWTAFHFAEYNEYTECVKHLLSDKDISVNIQNKKC